MLVWIAMMNALAADPIVIAHRGASGELPDHTLEAYRRAVEQGADYIEPDLVITRDGVLVARHDNELGRSTDVATKFADRKTTRTVDGETLTGWFIEDFTLAELQTLRARQPMDSRPKTHDGTYRIPTFDQVLDLRAELSATHGRAIGVYPETKHPSHFDALGLSLEEPLIASLEAHGLTSRADPVFIQSFEVSNLVELSKTTKLRLIQLVWTQGGPVDRPGLTWKQMLTPTGLGEIATYAAGIGAHKHLVIPLADDGTLGAPTRLVSDAHASGLLVHPYTFRDEDRYRPAGLDPVAEVRAYLDAGVDGVFCDHIRTGVTARSQPKR